MYSVQQKSGFTIVELLIVIVVIAILAAITIVAYNGIQNRTNDAAVQSDLKNFGKLIEIQKVDNSTYPGTLTSAMNFKFSKGSYGQDYQGANVRYCYDSSTDTYVLLSNSKSGNYYKVVNGVLSTNPATYGWGVCAILGLSSTNPSQNGFLASSSPQWATWTN